MDVTDEKRCRFFERHAARVALGRYQASCGGRQTPMPDTAVAVRVFMQILLVIVLGIVERFRGGDFRRHLARIARFTHGLLETLKAGARGGILLGRERINSRAVLCRGRCPDACPAPGRGFPRRPAGAVRS
jgi:nucleoside-diphosphate-sugar epimerase